MHVVLDDDLDAEIGVVGHRHAQQQQQQRVNGWPINATASAWLNPDMVASDQANQSPSTASATPETRWPHQCDVPSFAVPRPSTWPSGDRRLMTPPTRMLPSATSATMTNQAEAVACAFRSRARYPRPGAGHRSQGGRRTQSSSRSAALDRASTPWRRELAVRVRPGGRVEQPGDQHDEADAIATPVARCRIDETMVIGQR